MTMTPDQRLDQLERILATTIRLTQSNSEAILAEQEDLTVITL
jgi:hypothetical protein